MSEALGAAPAASREPPLPPLSFRHYFAVIVGSLLLSSFLWAADNDAEWFLLLTESRLSGRTAATLFASVGGGLAGGVTLWLLAAWLARRLGRVVTWREGLVRVSRAYWFFFPCAVSPMLLWRPMAQTPAFFVRTLVAAMFLAALFAIVQPFAGFAVRRPRSLWLRLWPYLLLIGLFFAVDRTLAGFYRHLSFSSNMDDLGLYDQIVYGLRHGLGFWTTIYPYPNHNFLSEHIMTSVALLVPFHFFWPNPLVYYVAQTAFIVLGAVAVAHLAMERTRTHWFPVLAVLAYMLYAPLERGWVNDFHADGMEVGLYLAAYWCFVKRWHFRYWIAIFFLLGCKEDVGLYVTALGFWMALFERRWLVGLSTMVVGFAWSATAILVVLPWLADAEANRQLFIYEHLGGSAGEIATTFVLRPHVVLWHLFQPERLVSIVMVLLPLAAINFFRPSTLLLLAPMTVTTILSSWPSQCELHTHYGMVFVAPAFIGLIEGWRVLEDLWRRRGWNLLTPSAWATALVVCSLLSNIEYAKFPIKRPFKWSDKYNIPDRRGEVMREIVRAVPRNAKVSAQNFIGAQMTHRKWIFKFPYAADEVEWVVLDTKTAGDLDQYEILKAANDLYLNKGYWIVKRVEGALLMRRGPRPEGVDDRLEFQYLNEKLSTY